MTLLSYLFEIFYTWLHLGCGDICSLEEVVVMLLLFVAIVFMYPTPAIALHWAAVFEKNI